MPSPVQGHQLWALHLSAGCKHRKWSRQKGGDDVSGLSHLVLLYALCLWQVCSSTRALVLLSLACVCHQLLGGSGDSGLNLIILLVDCSNDLHQLSLRLWISGQEEQQQRMVGWRGGISVWPVMACLRQYTCKID